MATDVTAPAGPDAAGTARDAMGGRDSRRTRVLAGSRAIARDHWRTALVVSVLAVLSWPYAGLVPGLDGDFNWIFGVEWAAKHGFDYGGQLDWTYGPLGFLTLAPGLYYGDVGLLTFAAQWIVQVLLVGTVYVAARRSFPTLVAFVIAGVIGTLLPDRQLAIGFAWCVLSLLRADDAPRDKLAAAFPVVIGIASGLLLLGKVNSGLEVTALAIVTLIARPRLQRRRLDAATFTGALVAAVVTGWLASGQRLTDLGPYVRYGKDLVVGYGGAMGLTDPNGEWHYWAALVLLVIGSVIVWAAVRDASPRRRVGLIIVWLIYAFFAYKEGFVRHDGGHVATFCGVMMVAFAVLPAARGKRSLTLAAAAAAVVVYAAVLTPLSLKTTLDPYQHVKAAVNQTHTLLVRNRRGATKSAIRQALQAHWNFPATLRDRIGSRTVAFWPQSLGAVVYGYQLNWRPLPVLEPYAAYTPGLDHLDAAMLTSSRAPENIVRYWMLPIDGRFGTFEAPETTLEILCRYREVQQAAPFQLLARSTDRCGPARPLSTVDARWGAAVKVPAPSTPKNAVIVRVHGAGPAGLEKLKALWLRPDDRQILLDGKPYRLIYETASDGLLLSVPPKADYPGAFKMAPDPATISISRSGSQPGGTLRYTFEEVPIQTTPTTSSSR